MPTPQMPAEAERRLAPHATSHMSEDAGLFKRPPCIINAALVPQFARNGRGDLIVRGFLECGTMINVVFAGRRVKDATVIEKQLRKLLSKARQGAGEGEQIDADTVRLYLRMHGSWRARFLRDKTGCETRDWQFVAAQWGMTDTFGTVRQFGEPPHLARPVAPVSGDGV